jgi:hypothetical protein
MASPPIPPKPQACLAQAPTQHDWQLKIERHSDAFSFDSSGSGFARTDNNNPQLYYIGVINQVLACRIILQRHGKFPEMMILEADESALCACF